KGKIGHTVATHVLDDHVHVDVGVGQGLEQLRCCAGLVWQPHHNDLYLILVERYAAHDHIFHGSNFLFHNRTLVIVHTAAHFENDSVLFGELNTAGLHDLGAQAGEFEHFVVGDFVDLRSIGDNAWIGRVNAIHVCVNLAKVCA